MKQKFLWCQAVIDEARIEGGFFRTEERKCLAPVSEGDRCRAHVPRKVWA